MRAKVTFELEAPAECTKEQFLEWLSYELAQERKIKMDNPLEPFELEGLDETADYVTIEIIKE